MKRFITWLVDKFYDNDDEEDLPIRPAAPRVKPTPVRRNKPVAEAVEIATEMEGKIEDGGPGKNVLVKNKYLREDTGTHETLKILDDSLVDSGEETGIDPYNTGGFDRSKNWNNRFRK